MVDDTQPCTGLNFEICTLAKFRTDVLFHHNFLILLIQEKKLVQPYLDHLQIALEREKPELS